MLRFCLELTKKQLVKNSANLKLLKIEIFQGGRAKKYFVYFKTDNEEKAYFQLFQASSGYFVSAILYHNFKDVATPIYAIIYNVVNKRYNYF